MGYFYGILILFINLEVGMKKLICVFIFCILTFTGCSSDKEKKSYKITSDEQLVLVMEQYQFKKLEVDLDAVTAYLSESDILSEPTAKAPVSGFYIGILKENPEKFKKLANDVNSPSLESVLKSSKEFSTDMEMILSGEQKYYPENPSFLDSLWGYYYATGDERVIKEMCSIKNYAYDPVLRGAANWSLKAHKEKFPDKIKDCN